MAENGKTSEGTVPMSLRVPMRLKAALDRLLASETAKGTGADQSDCARRAMSAGLEVLGYPVESPAEQPSPADDLNDPRR